MNETLVTEVEAEVEISEIEAEIKGILDGITAIKKVKGIGAVAREAAEGPLKDQLRAALVEFGDPVARGNTVYTIADGELLVIDLTPKVLVRL